GIREPSSSVFARVETKRFDGPSWHEQEDAMSIGQGALGICITVSIVWAGLGAGCLGEDMGNKKVSPPRALFPILRDHRWGYMDSHGNVVVRPIFVSANDFSEGLALTWTNQSAGFINENGSMAFVLPYGRKELDWVGDFSGGFAWFSTRGKYGCVNR